MVAKLYAKDNSRRMNVKRYINERMKRQGKTDSEIYEGSEKYTSQRGVGDVQ